ncbi:hypothetical protein CEXT_212911 [Caerostris extrusa]|uniref:Uncharacterized protein n=1 Tax=Caerostris extrusa TaxID=172846 RepID=A0AAV4UDE1_CAEEX|nr:hypothetical protein CEXT_212911 [Caerostris extrusa]
MHGNDQRSIKTGEKRGWEEEYDENDYVYRGLHSKDSFRMVETFVIWREIELHLGSFRRKIIPEEFQLGFKIFSQILLCTCEMLIKELVL